MAGGWYVEYTDATGVGCKWPEIGYTSEQNATEFIEQLPYEQQVTAELMYYDPNET